jgi:PAP2 superfamily C-terminal
MKTFVKFLLACTLYGIVGYINEFITENQVYHTINQQPLFDRGHNALPLFPRLYPDIGVLLLVGYFILRWGIKYPNILIDYILMLSVLFIGRMILLMVTQFPPAHPGCSTLQPGTKPHLLLWQKRWKTCMDYMYSGHTFHCVLVALFVLYVSTNRIETSVVLLATLAELILIIGSRIHYSTDVCVATLVSILVFFAWPGHSNLLEHITTHGRIWV